MVSIEINKSPIPMVWLDTSVIINMTIYKNRPEQLEPTQREWIRRLYEQVRSASHLGKILCPLADQELEVWINRDEWLDTIHDLALGIECASLQTVQKNQMRAAIKAHLAGESKVTLSYQDAFLHDPVDELKRTLKGPIFVTVRRGIIFGADYHKTKNKNILAQLNKARETNVSSRVSFEEQLKVEQVGELKLLLTQCVETLNDSPKSDEEDDNEFFGYIELGKRVRYWTELGGQPPDIYGYIEFYKSEHNTKCPYNELGANLFAKIMTDSQPIRSGDPMDIQHIATLMPYSNLFITDKAWSTYLNRSGNAAKYGTEVCYVGNTTEISRFFESLA